MSAFSMRPFSLLDSPFPLLAARTAFLCVALCVKLLLPKLLWVMGTRRVAGDFVGCPMDGQDGYFEQSLLSLHVPEALEDLVCSARAQVPHKIQGVLRKMLHLCAPAAQPVKPLHLQSSSGQGQSATSFQCYEINCKLSLR